VEFWSESQLASIHTMLHPRSIAVIGASPKAGTYGGRVMGSVLKSQDRVPVFPVNPRYEEVMGLRCFPSVEALPEAPDLVIVVVPHGQVVQVLEASSRRGVRAGVVISAGFAERGTAKGRQLQHELAAFTQQSGLRITGPNCLGVANVLQDVWSTGSPSGPKSGCRPGPVGLICQSGATAFAHLSTRAADLGVGLSYIISTGNEADLEFADFARYLLDDPDTKVIAGFVEGFKTGPKFKEMARLAAERGKPLVMIKVGRSDVGARAAGSHTASLTGSDEAYQAMFAQYGITRAQDPEELLEIANLLARAPKPRQPGLAVVSHSGGVSSLTSDVLGAAGLDVPLLEEDTRTYIADILGEFGWASNPADLTGHANDSTFAGIIGHMMDQPNMGVLVAASAGKETQVNAVLDVARRTGKAAVYMWTGSRSDKDGLPLVKDAGLPLFYTPASLARGLVSLRGYHRWREARLRDGFAVAAPVTTEQQEVIAQLQAHGAGTLSEFESKQVLAAWGVPVTRELQAATAAAAVTAADSLGYPVALKLDSPDVIHKTEAGAVRLGLNDAAAVRAAYDQLLAGGKAHAPDARIHGVLVQEMIADGVEVIVGVSYDPQLGPMLLCGSGGVLVEVYEDVALRCCPVTRAEAKDMIGQLKGARLLSGFRGRPAADVEALADVLVKVSQLAVQLEPCLAELDINPVMVLPAGRGVTAVDALVALK
jgi:acetate---CoA ligase (ADP-forming)